MQTLLAGIGSGVAGMAGPTVRILKDTRTALGSKAGFRNAMRKIARNLNAKKGNPEFNWIKTSGEMKQGGYTDRAFPGMGAGPRRIVSRATRSEGSGYNAQSILNNNPVYQQARKNPSSLGYHPSQTPATNQGYTTSNRVFQRNRLIDQARDWRNWIFK